MTEPRITIVLEDHSRIYHPGDVLAGQFNVAGIPPGDIRAVELSVLWHTEGKGDEDMSVHFFQRVEPQNGDQIDLGQPRPFTTVLPNSPLSYRGEIVKICWCVRVRVFAIRGKEIILEVPFQLGTVPQPQPVLS